MNVQARNVPLVLIAFKNACRVLQCGRARHRSRGTVENIDSGCLFSLSSHRGVAGELAHGSRRQRFDPSLSERRCNARHIDFFQRAVQLQRTTPRTALHDAPRPFFPGLPQVVVHGDVVEGQIRLGRGREAPLTRCAVEVLLQHFFVNHRFVVEIHHHEHVVPRDHEVVECIDGALIECERHLARVIHVPLQVRKQPRDVDFAVPSARVVRVTHEVIKAIDIEF